MKDKSKRLTVVNTDKKKADENASHILQQKPASALNAAGFNPALYLLKSVWDSVFEIKTDVSGQKYLFGKLPMVTQYGVTMYGDNDELNVSDIYEGLPIDNVTLYWDNGVLKAKGGEGGGGGVADSIAWANVYGKPSWVTDTKPIYNYSEINGTPDLSVFVTGTALSNTLADYATLTYLTGELKKYVTIKDDQDIVGVKNFLNGIKISNMPIRKLQDDVIYIDANLVVRGGVTMYSDNEVDIPSIKDEIGFAGYNGSVGLASFDSSQFVISANGTVSVKGGSTGLDTAQLKEYLDSNKYTTETWVKAQGYASASSLSSLQTKVDNFLEGSDTDTIINKWKELEAFLSGLSESDNLATILSTKWTTDNNLINQWNTAYGWGDHSKVGYALKSYVDNNFVTLGTQQTITGEKNFTGGLKVNGSPIYYDATNKYWKLEGDLLVTGGVSMYSNDSEFTPSTIMDALLYDENTLGINDNGELYVKGGNGGSTTKYPLSWSGFNQGSYDGSVAQSFYIPTKLSEFVNDKSFATTSDLSNYLQKSGGTLTGSIILDTASTTSHLSYYIRRNGNIIGLGSDYYNTCLRFSPSTGGSHFFKLSDTGMHYSADTGNTWSEVLHSGNYSSYALPKNNTSVVWVTNSNQGVVNFKSTAEQTGIRLYNGDTNRGGLWYGEDYGIAVFSNSSQKYLGIKDDGTPHYWDKTNSYTLLHTGNYSSYALPLSGGTLTGSITFPASQYNLNGVFGINLNNSDIVGANSIYFQDPANTNNEGLQFVRSDGNYDVVRAYDGVLMFATNQSLGGDGASYNTVWHSGNLTSLKNPYALSWSGYSSGSYDGSSAKSITIPSNTNQLTNGAGFITSSASITGNAGSATKLQTARTIWGQSFNGTGDISGTLYLNNNVSISGYVNNVAYDIFRINENSHLLVGYGHAPKGNTSIYGNNVYLRIGANREYALTALANGNVGIGITNPEYKLHVVGESLLSQSANGNLYYRIRGVNYELGFGLGSGGVNRGIYDWTNGSWMIYRDSSANVLIPQGYVGIGTTSPSQKLHVSGNILTTGGITMYSDIRKKTKLQDVELSLSQIANAPLIQHYYNSDQDKTTHVGSIAQYWANLNDWFCKLDAEGFYTMEIQNCALASAISIARHLEKYESKTDKTIRKMKKRIQELEDEVERLKKGA